MKDGEFVFAVVVLVAAYWWFGIRGGRSQLKGNVATSATGSTSPGIGTGGSKKITRHQNSNPRTNANTGRGNTFRPAPIASVGVINGQGRSQNAGTPTAQGGMRSSSGRGLVTSFISPSWPTRKVTSTGSRTISSGQVQVPSYTAVPLTIQGPGGGGSWLNSSSAVN